MDLSHTSVGERGPQCCVVFGPDEVATRRTEFPDCPVVAVVDGVSPIQAVLAQAAGADVVLPTWDLQSRAPGDVPGLPLAMQAATAIATRRRELARSSRKTSHDLAEALNVMGLAAEVGANGVISPNQALAHIARLAGAAGADAWRTGRMHRMRGQSLEVVDVVGVVRGAATTDGGVEAVVPTGQVWVFADERHLVAAVAELVRNARRAGAHCVRLAVAQDPHDATIVVSDDGMGFPPEQRAALGEPHIAPSSSGRLGLGLATIAEFATSLGGSLTVTEPDPLGWATTLRLSLPLVRGDASKAFSGKTPIDQATAQANILEGIVRRAPLCNSLDAIVTAIEDQIPESACSILLLRDGKTLHHGAGASLPATYRSAIDGVPIGLNQGSCGTAAFTGRPVIATDVTKDPIWVRFRDVATKHGFRSCWSTPIVAAEGGEVLGTFAVYKSSVWSPDRAATRLVQRFTDLATVAIEHHRLFGALAESESRFRSAFEGASAGMALVHPDGSLIKINPSLVTLLERSEAVLLSSNLLDFVHPEWRERIRESWVLLANGKPNDTTARPTLDVPLLAGPADDHVWVSVNTSIIEAEGERYFYVEVRDLTAIRKHLADQRAREAAEASSRAKTDFLALVSHELRTPLNAILGFAQVMQLTELDADQSADSLDQIVRAGRHLRDLISDLLDLSRIDAGQLAVVSENIDPVLVMREALDLVGPLAEARDISLIGDRSGARRHHVLADRRCLRQILINLLGNAVKYTPTGGRVEIEVREVDDGVVRISVHDNGPGIASDSFPELFQPFHRLKSVRSRSEGTGLGLALTARLVAEMRGTIGVASTVGAGSSFWVEFPPVVVAADNPVACARSLLRSSTP